MAGNFGSFCVSSMHYRRYHQALAEETAIEVNQARLRKQAHMQHPLPTPSAEKLVVAQTALKRQSSGDGYSFN